MAIQVRLLDPAAMPAWDAFVAASPTATFFHRGAWAEVFRAAFGHTPHYLMAEQDGWIETREGWEAGLREIGNGIGAPGAPREEVVAAAEELRRQGKYS